MDGGKLGWIRVVYWGEVWYIGVDSCGVLGWNVVCWGDFVLCILGWNAVTGGLCVWERETERER